MDAVLARAVAFGHPDPGFVQGDGQVIGPLHGNGKLLRQPVQPDGLHHLAPVEDGGGQGAGGLQAAIVPHRGEHRQSRH